MRTAAIGVAACTAAAVALLVLLSLRHNIARPDTIQREAAAPATRTSSERSGKPFAVTGAALAIAGTVTFNGAPYAGATVRLHPGSLATMSDAGGAFQFPYVPTYAREVVVTAPGKLGTASTLPVGDSRTRMLINLVDCSHTVAGHVTDVAGGNVPRPLLRGSKEGEHWRSESVGDANGRFEICVPSAMVRLEVAAPAYATISELIDASNGHADFVVSPEAIIEGRILSRERMPIAFATANAFATGTVVQHIVEADENGAFHIDGMAPGRYSVLCQGTGWMPFGIEVETAVDRAASVECVLNRGRRIVGRVYEGDVPVANLIVFMSSSTGISDARTSADGTFVFDALPEGALELRLQSADILIQEPPVLPKSGDMTSLIVRIGRRASVAGLVRRGDEHLASAVVEMRPTNQQAQTTHTDASGHFGFRDIPAGRLALRATSADGLEASESVDVTLRPGDNIDNVELDLTRRHGVVGAVLDSNGAPVAGALVRFQSGADEVRCVTDTHGQFRAVQLAGQRSYKVEVFNNEAMMFPLPPARSTAFPTLRLADQRTLLSGVRLIVQRDFRDISGHVLDEGGMPVSDAMVGVAEVGSPQRWADDTPPAHTVTMPDGRFVLNGLPSGEYMVIARAPAGGMAVMSPVRMNGVPITLVIPDETIVKGTLNGFRGIPNVVATDFLGRQHEGQVTGREFVVERLPRGRSQVLAWEPGAHQAALDVAWVEVAPPKTALISLKRRSTFTVVVNLSASQASDPSQRCSVDLPDVFAIPMEHLGLRQFSTDVPLGLEANVQCRSDKGVVTRSIPAGVQAGTLVELSLIDDSN